MGTSNSGPSSLVTRRIQEWNAKLNDTCDNVHLLRHGTFPSPKQPMPKRDYRNMLKHINVSRQSIPKETIVWPHLRHYHRKSEVRTRSSSFSNASRTRKTSSISERQSRQRYKSPEIEMRKSLRPMMQHACGHLAQVAMVGISDGDQQERMYERSPEGSLIVVGPRLHTKKAKQAAEVPYLCSECQARAGTEIEIDIPSKSPDNGDHDFHRLEDQNIGNTGDNLMHARSCTLSTLSLPKAPAGISPVSTSGACQPVNQHHPYLNMIEPVSSTLSRPSYDDVFNEEYHSAKPSTSLSIENDQEFPDARMMPEFSHNYELLITTLGHNLRRHAQELRKVLSMLQDTLSSVEYAQTLASALFLFEVPTSSRSTSPYDRISPAVFPFRPVQFGKEPNPANEDMPNLTTNKTSNQQHDNSPQLSIPGAFLNINSDPPTLQGTPNLTPPETPPRSPLISDSHFNAELRDQRLVSPKPRRPSMPQLLSLIQNTAQQDLGINLPLKLSPALHIKVYSMMSSKAPSILQSSDEAVGLGVVEDEESEGEETEYITAHHRWRWRWLVLTDEEE